MGTTPAAGHGGPSTPRPRPVAVVRRGKAGGRRAVLPLRAPQLAQAGGRVELVRLARGGAREAGEGRDPVAPVERLRSLAGEASDQRAFDPLRQLRCGVSAAWHGGIRHGWACEDGLGGRDRRGFGGHPSLESMNGGLGAARGRVRLLPAVGLAVPGTAGPALRAAGFSRCRARARRRPASACIAAVRPGCGPAPAPSSPPRPDRSGFSCAHGRG